MQGLEHFNQLLIEEYDLPLDHWAGLSSLSDEDCASLTHALEILIIQPIAEATAARPRQWRLSDEKIADKAWEKSWQWHLLAAIDNGTRDETSGMMTPSDPRLFLLRLRYGRGIFASFADYLTRVFCGRASVRQAAGDISALRQALLQVPGLESAAPAFIAGLVFLISKLGFENFCDYCEDLL